MLRLPPLDVRGRSVTEITNIADITDITG